jgi:excisionase family DNA binding protein
MKKKSMMTVSEVANMYDLARNTVYRMVKERRIPCYRVGTKKSAIRFDKAELLAHSKRKATV